MQTLARLFGRSPFAPLQTHMAKVAQCVKEVHSLFEALEKEDYPLIETIAHRISKLEHEADLTKNDIRNHLPTGLFMPIARASLLEILALQDCIADHAENIGVLLTLRRLSFHSAFIEDFKKFLNKNIDCFHGAHRILQELGDLLESSFGGVEAEKVRVMVEEVAFKEHESDLLQRKLLKKLFSDCDGMAYQDFYLWMKLIQEVSGLSNVSEKLANRVRMTLEIK